VKMRILISPYKHREASFINDKGERVPSHRYREIRDGMNAEPAQDLKDDPEVIRILNALDILERESRPSLGADAKRKDMAADDAIAFAAGLVDYVAGWAIDHQRGLAQRSLPERELRKEQFKHAINPTRAPPEYPTPEPPDEDHSDEKEGAFRGQLDPVQTRRFLFNVLRLMAPRLVPSPSYSPEGA
jgi:hypothetical protein